MRNLKRALSLALASVMLLGMMVVGTSASYADVSSKNNLEAIEVLKAVGVMTGDDKGNFNPDANVTRNEMAVIMCNLLGLKAGGSHPFTDVPAWAQGYVAACYNNGIIAGVSADKFNGDANVTAVQASLMVMKALGYFGFAGEFGDNWKLSVVKQANKIDLYNGINAYTDQIMTRNEVAQLVLNALECTVQVVTEQGGLTVDGNGISVNVKPTYTYEDAANNSGRDYASKPNTRTMELCEKLYDTDLRKNGDVTDDFGRPASEWTYHTTSIKCADEATLTYTKDVKIKDIYADLGKPSNAFVEDTSAANGADGKIVIDGQQGQQDNSTADINVLKDNGHKVGAKGTLTEVYYDKNSGEVNIICTNTYLAQATADYNEKDEKLNITVYAAAGKTFNSNLSADDFAIANYKEDDYILVTAYTSNGTNYTVKEIAPATVVSDVKVSAYAARDYITAGGTKYTMNATAAADNSGALGEDTILDGTSVSLQSTTYDLVLDANGYLLGATTHSNDADLSDYLFVTDFAQSGFDWMAKVVFSDGTKKTVTVAKAKASTGALIDVAGEGTANSEPATAGYVSEGWFYTYNVNKDGGYELTSIAASRAGYAATATIDSGKVVIVSGTTTKGTSSTVVIADGKVTTGIKNAPNVAAGPVWYLNDANGYTQWVFSKQTGSVPTDADEIVYIYDVASKGTAKDENDNTYYVYKAVVKGEKTTINVDATTDKDGTAIAAGLYVIGSYDNGYVDASYLTKVASGAPGAAYKAVTAVSAVTYKNGTLNVTGTGDQGGYVLADNVVIYSIETQNSGNGVDTVKSIKGNYIKNLTIAGGDEEVYLVQKSATDTEIVALYIVIK